MNCFLTLQGQLMGVLNALSGWSNSMNQMCRSRITVQNTATELYDISVSYYMITYPLMVQSATFSQLINFKNFQISTFQTSIFITGFTQKRTHMKNCTQSYRLLLVTFIWNTLFSQDLLNTHVYLGWASEVPVHTVEWF